MRLFGVLIFCSLFLTPVVKANYVEDSIVKAADKVGVPAKLLRAICVAESRLQPGALNYMDGGDNNHAFGICQVLYATAQGWGFKDERCKDDFRDKERSYQTCKLFGPYTNAFYAAKVLKFQLDRYKGSWISAIAAYNSGSLKVCKSGKVYRKRDRKVLYTCEVGGLLNQRYVDRVLKNLES